MDEKTTYADMVHFFFDRGHGCFGEREVINVTSLTLYLWQISPTQVLTFYDKYINILT